MQLLALRLLPFRRQHEDGRTGKAICGIYLSAAKVTQSNLDDDRENRARQEAATATLWLPFPGQEKARKVSCLAGERAKWIKMMTQENSVCRTAKRTTKLAYHFLNILLHLV